MSTFTILLLAGFALNAGLILLGFVLADRQRRRHIARLQRQRDILSLPVSRRLKNRKRTLAQPSTATERFVAFFERQLDQTSLRIGVNELLLQVGIGLLGGYALAVLALGIHPLTALPVAAVLTFGLLMSILNIAQNRYKTAFAADLPEALDIFARGLRAGRPVTDSMSIVVDNSKGPILHEFSRCHDEVRMGTSLPECLERLSARLPLAEVNFFAVSTALQAETGGNLIETIENLATQLRERRKLRKKARALSSEARASAVILAALPFAVTLLIAVLNGTYLEPLYADPRGRIMSATALGSIAFGIFVMVRMGKLDV
ncbi:type II secretion system F family protein [Sulfitobacter sp. M57]|uniref:type II secretion system F family protein n=1 Tax=unclassified Sulfitobacter TaxID=196795 RepID=UPI0023E20AAE|nr:MULTISPECIES: type II secretion system F family protein [unclassified Sulfitobacter]MDF3413764.1 type II secretion system F family protein [Sulfitobacter sp. KE5]MDF3420955.1 type II secretion system F family protein [Sulfitobacter sp. KE43]MDF3432310.1 type II secretion system F family protein [Sulfitobacter sp. KE42]MDF3457949.1 type II secretion system F family protein [Sulfitobacter sp. S74]MDF3461850.1 type II secretion system F family protein [Sulfitobacter sp. Ks18]